MEAVMIYPEAATTPDIGSGTPRDPYITWLMEPPNDAKRRVANEMVARELGYFGYSHVWIRHCDHMTTRVQDGPQSKPRFISCDCHITVYAGYEPGLATKQGHVYCIISARKGVGRIMGETERTANGKSVNLHPFPSHGQRNIPGEVVMLPTPPEKPVRRRRPSHVRVMRARTTRRGSMCGSPLRYSETSMPSR